MTSFRNNSIARKLTFIITITAIIVLTICSIVLVVSQFYSSREAIAHELNSIAGVSAFAVAPAMLFGDNLAAQKILQALETQPDLLAAELYLNNAGVPFARFTSDKKAGVVFAQQNINQELCRRAVFTRQQVILCIPVEMDGDILGRLYLQADLLRLYKELGRLLAIFSGVLPVVGLLAFLTAHRLGTILARPVRHLANIAIAISHDENYALRAKKYANDEVGQLTESFNAMLEQIQLRDEMLNAHSRKLEQLVEQRTRSLSETVQQLSESNEELKDFSYIVSHDLRAPMINVQGFVNELGLSLKDLRHNLDTVMELMPEHKKTELLDILDEDIPASTRFITGGIAKMNQLLGGILKISRLGRQELNISAVDTQRLVNDDIVAIKYQSDRAKAEIQVQALPQVQADPYLLTQIFANLLSNAIKYLDPKRPGKIEIWAEDQDNYFRFFVKDNGLGISEKDQKKVFEMFRRGSNHSVEGEGVGLNYVKSAIKRLGGTIAVESTVGHGSTFSFTLPKEIDANPELQATSTNPGQV
ncbi:sensor histidine kinase [Methylobacter sp.]|uniref:sensor histidine kinase n=1 Tax=Methylobacter sp. TaxID=2051955 RepID=UPI002FDC9901